MSNESQDLEIMQGGALSDQLRTETETAIDIAKRYPRNIKQVKDKFLAYTTCDEETAASCFYSKPVDNKGTLAEGPSIRMAEIAAATYGNIRYGSRVISIEEKWITVQSLAIDLETNLAHYAEEKRSIWSDKGRYRYSANMIQTTIKAAAAIANRDAIFKVIPLAIFNNEIKDIKRVATGAAGNVPLPDRAKKAVFYFESMNISKERVYARLGVANLKEVTEEHLEQLTGLKSAIKYEEVSIEEAFPKLPSEVQKEKSTQAQDGVSDLLSKPKE